MSINSISDIYYKYLQNSNSKLSETNESNKVSDNTSTSETSTAKTSNDSLTLNSSLLDSSNYLNYNSSGTYSSLSDYLGEENEDEDNDLFSLLENDSSETEDFFNTAGSTTSIDTLFSQIAGAKTDEIDALISKALEKIKSANSEK